MITKNDVARNVTFVDWLSDFRLVLVESDSLLCISTLPVLSYHWSRMKTPYLNGKALEREKCTQGNGADSPDTSSFTYNEDFSSTLICFFQTSHFLMTGKPTYAHILTHNLYLMQ